MYIPRIAKQLPAPVRMAGNRLAAQRASRVGLRASDAIATQVAKSPFFDAEYYAAQRGLSFDSSLAAARDWMRAGARKGYALHPLIDPAYIPGELREKLSAREFDSYVAWLTAPENRSKPWGPLFVPDAALDGADSASVEAYFANLAPSQVIAPPRGFQGSAPTWGPLREASITHARATRAQAAVPVPGKYANWDAVREAVWLAEAESLPVADDALVSIIMPTWNREALIRVAIQSVAAQTHRAWELIIVDDGSTDATIEIAEQAASEDSRIRLIKLPHGGVAKARNAGVRAAVGDYLAFLDTDNEWTHRHLELSVRWLAAHSANVATHNGLRITEADGSVTYRGAEIGIEALAKRSLIDMNSLVVRRGVALARGGFDESLARWVDYALMLDIAEQGDIAYLPFIGCEYFDGDASDRITRRESVHWQFVAAARHVVRWDELRTTQNDRIRGRVSIVILVYEDFVHTLLGVDRVLQTTADQDVEVILVDNGSHLATSRIVAARYHNHPRVTYRRLSRNYNFATGCNYGFSISSGEYVLLLNHDTIVRDGWLGPLVERLESTDAIGVQPLILNPNGTTQAAGAVFVFDEKVPAQFLARLPREDAFRHDGKGFAAVHGVALLMRSDLFEKLRGFDPIYANGLEDYDLCLRACELTGGRFEVEPRSLVEHTEARTPGRFARSEENKRIFLDRWRGRIPTGDEKKFKDLGLEVAHTRPLPGGHGWLPVLVRPKRTVHVEGFGKIPSLRWAVKIGASGSYRADWWGDTIFSEDLRVALEKLGQEVVVDRYGAFERDTAYLDDVVLTVRGVRPPVVQMGRVNLMWVISRPELVSATEIRSQDLVYAASGPWARRMTAESGVDVRTMLQATNPGRFRPEARSSDLRSDVLFVGGAREAIGGRPLVEMALKSGVDLSLWGPGWDLVAPGNTRGEYLPFSRTPEAYASCNVVLNDHMDPMREHGFVSNRTFDAVASGAAVISDEIDGLELFQGAVRPCGSLEEMEELSADRSWIPDRARFKEISAMIAREHSFDARAAVMLRDVLNLLG